MNRKENIKRVRLHQKKPYDFVIIGGGASGVGCAVDAASRGFDVLLLEQVISEKGHLVVRQNWFMEESAILNKGIFH